MELTIKGKKAYAYTGGKSFDASLPTVVFCHGGQHDHSVWILQSRYLANHGYSVLALDLPGHGRSEGPALARIEDLADWIAAVLDAAGVKQASVVGHSMGSLIALECAARHPARLAKIALLATAYPMKVSAELLDATKNNEPLAQDMVNIWSHLAYAQYPNNPGPGFWLIGENLRLMQRQKPGVMHVDFSACNAYAGGEQAAAKVGCPALFVIARRDVMTPARSAQAFAQSVKGSRCVVIEGSGHNMMGEKPDEVLDALVKFLM